MRHHALAGRWAALLVALAAAACSSSTRTTPSSGSPPPSSGTTVPTPDGPSVPGSTPPGGTTPGSTSPGPDGSGPSAPGQPPPGGGSPPGAPPTTPPAGPPATPPGGGPPTTPPAALDDWPSYRHDVRGSSRSSEPFTRSDAAALREVWSLDIGQFGYAQPIRVGDTVYAATAVAGSVVAVDAATGAARWRRDLRATLHSDCAQATGEWANGDNDPGIWGALAWHDGALFAGAPDGHVYALDAGSGATRWSALVANAAPHAELVESSPTVSSATGRVYVGVAAVAHCDPALGRVAGIDLATHQAVQHPFVDGDARGAGMWSSAVVDEPAGVLYAATGNAVGSAAAEPFAQSVVALDPATLAPLDHWQNAAGGLVNCDFGASPTLLEDAAGRKLLAAASKDGWLYVFDRTRLSAGPVWKTQLAIADPADPTHCGDPLAGYGTIVSPTFSQGTLYAGGGRTPAGDLGSVVALDPATGAVRWRHATPGYVISAIAAAGDVLVAASNVPGTRDTPPRSTLEILDANDGSVLRSFAGASETFAAPSVSRGLVLWLTFQGRLTALGR